MLLVAKINQSLFVCVACGHEANADVNAAIEEQVKRMCFSSTKLNVAKGNQVDEVPNEMANATTAATQVSSSVEALGALDVAAVTKLGKERVMTVNFEHLLAKVFA